MLLVMIALVMGSVLAMTFLGTQSTAHGIAQNIHHHAQARAVAESGLVIAIAHIQQNADWRTTFADGLWLEDQSFQSGTFTVWGEDGYDENGDGIIDGDGDLADDDSDPLTLTVLGSLDGVTHQVQAVVHPAGTGSSSLTVLLVVDDASDLTSQDQAKQELMEGWGYTVNLISASASQANFTSAAAAANVAYITEDVKPNDLNTKLTSATIGIVIEEPDLYEDLGIASKSGGTFQDTKIYITDNSHDITSTFDTGQLTIASSKTLLARVKKNYTDDLQVLATSKDNSDDDDDDDDKKNNSTHDSDDDHDNGYGNDDDDDDDDDKHDGKKNNSTHDSEDDHDNGYGNDDKDDDDDEKYPVLAVLDTGDALEDGGTAAGRRVVLPFGGSTFNVSSLNANGRTLMQRSLQWAGDASPSAFTYRWVEP
jgi:hypothetical protein